MDMDAVIMELSERYDSFYLYQEAEIRRQIRRLKRAFPSVAFLYSVKCNANRQILKTVFEEGLGADAASAGEVLLSRQAGCPDDFIYYSAPGKTPADIEKATGEVNLIADSLNEIERIEAAAKRRQITARIGIRIHPASSFDGSPAQPSKFGIDEEQAMACLRGNRSSAVQIAGIHVHLRSQELNAAKLEQYYRRIMSLAGRLQKECGLRLDYINMGSGIGIPFSEGDAALDIEALGRGVESEIGKFRQVYPDMRFLIETGRFITGEGGIYATKVLDRKTSCGKTYLIVKNTLNGFLRPSLARLVARYAGEAPTAGSEPLFTGVDAFSIRAVKPGPAAETVTVAGNLCTAADVIAEDIALPRLDCGDVLTISNAGAYGASLSPMQFSSQERPAELFLTADGQVVEG